MNKLGKINLGGDGLEKFIESEGLLFQIEDNSLEVDISIADLLDQANELFVLVGRGRMLDHTVDGVVEFVVVRVKIDNFRPQLVSFTDSEQFGDVQILLTKRKYWDYY